MNNNFTSNLQYNPIIAAVSNLDNLEEALKSPCDIIFMLTGDIFNLKMIVEKVKAAGKSIYIHVDLIDGFSKDQVALKYINENIKPDGIITTKTNLIKKAKELNIFVVQRIFILDSLSIESGLKAVGSVRPDALEILPGTITKTIKWISDKIRIPIIASGLVEDKEDVILSLKAGSLGISTSKQDIWYM